MALVHPLGIVLASPHSSCPKRAFFVRFTVAHALHRRWPSGCSRATRPATSSSRLTASTPRRPVSAFVLCRSLPDSSPLLSFDCCCEVVLCHRAAVFIRRRCGGSAACARGPPLAALCDSDTVRGVCTATGNMLVAQQLWGKLLNEFPQVRLSTILQQPLRFGLSRLDLEHVLIGFLVLRVVCVALQALGPINPNNAAIAAKFGNQGGY